MRVQDGICIRCNCECDGTFVRTNPNHSRVIGMLAAPEVPRFSGGGIALCWGCQRAVQFAKGFNELIIKDLKRGCVWRWQKPVDTKHVIDARVEVWTAVLEGRMAGKSVAQISSETGITEGSVYDAMRRMGLPTDQAKRKETRCKAKLDEFGRSRARKVMQMRIGGQSWNSIAALMGESKEAVMAAAINLEAVDG